MKDKVPSTNAIRYLNEKKIPYNPVFYKYVEHGGTKVSAKELGVNEHNVIKTLIMENDRKEYFFKFFFIKNEKGCILYESK